MKRYLLILLVAATLFLSQVACSEEVREPISDLGCRDTACRDACGDDYSCKIACCQK